MNKRQLQIQRSLGALGIERLTNFINAEPVRESDVLAVRLLRDALDRGEDLEAELLGSTELSDFLDDSGYTFKVTRRSANRFRIALGYQAGPLAGDGGEWEVTFDDEGRVVNVDGEIRWLS
ncbi:protein of unknown function [Candidatus Promineifilum breve]|uniref:Uncharacterized protein n=1 Tax=Candidatus Promineifilum breve TaxID=1806508 RepID=A0A160T3I7_9CHLR|nr:hypothetical protein [Candidatus Promineifilum breve]CUS04334.2 protein of unknown function [Candidatus Promineifilum breve]